MPPPSPKFLEALAIIDRENSQDPNRVSEGNTLIPKELAYSKRLMEWVIRLCPEASEALLLAARSQHICRWLIPRNSQPMDRTGYLKWREELKKFHAAKTTDILQKVGYSQDFIEQVRGLNLKKDIPTNPECQVLEDALCLVFLEDQLSEFALRTDEEKLIGILKKTWPKMSPLGHEHALKLDLDERARTLLQRALAS